MEGIVTELTDLAVSLRNEEDAVIVEEDGCKRLLLLFGTWKYQSRLVVHGLAAFLALSFRSDAALVRKELDLDPLLISG